MPISTEDREEFKRKKQPLDQAIEQSLKKESALIAEYRKDPSKTPVIKLSLCEEMVYVTTLYVAINNLSLELLGAKNNDALEKARKVLYKAIIYLEDIVSNVVDCPYAELEDKIATIAEVSLERRFYLVKKLGLSIDILWAAFGDNSKWKWTFIEIRGRFAVVAKNLIDMKQAVKVYYDLQHPDYDNTVLYIRLLRKLLSQSAGEYRDKYELSTRRIDDMRVAINFIIANRRIAVLLGDKEDAEELKKKAAVWKEKMEADQKAGSSH